MAERIVLMGTGANILLYVYRFTSVKGIKEYIAVSVGAGRGAAIEVRTRESCDRLQTLTNVLVRTLTRRLT